MKEFKTISAFIAYYMDKDVVIVGDMLVYKNNCRIALNETKTPCEQVVEDMDKEQAEKFLIQIKTMLNLEYILVQDIEKKQAYYFK